MQATGSEVWTWPAAATGLGEAAVRALCQESRPQPYPAHFVLWREGEPGDCLYVIASGRVKIRRRTATGEVILAMRGPGEMVGELALIDGRARMADAITMEATTLLPLGREAFLEQVRHRPELALAVMSALARRLREAADRLTIRSQDVTARVAAALLDLPTSDRAREAREGKRLGLAVSLRELAAWTRSTPETVCRVLKRFEQLRIIRRSGSQLILLDEVRLRQRCARGSASNP